MSDEIKVYTTANDQRTADKTYDGNKDIFAACVIFSLAGLAMMIGGLLENTFLLFGFGGIALAAGILFLAAHRALYYLQRINAHLYTLNEKAP